MEIFGIRIELANKAEEKELARALKILDKHGLRAVKKTKDKTKKSEAAKRAAADRAAKTKLKVENAIDQLKKSNKKITVAEVARAAGVSRPAAKKYIEQLEEGAETA